MKSNKVTKAAKSGIIIIAFLCLISYVLKHYDATEYRIEQVDAYVERMCQIADVPGMSIVVWNDNQESYINVGYADKRTNVEATSNTQYELGSTTKAFTALGVLLLEQDGMLDRNDSVSEYLPWFSPIYNGDEVDVTIEHLLCHTSGVPVWTISTLPIGTINDKGMLEQTIRTIQSVELDNLPGTVHNYATINYDVLALIIEEVSGVTYEEYIEQNVLEPLGMYDSYFRVDDSKTEQLAMGYRHLLMGVQEYNAPTFYGNTAAGYLVSTTKDLAIWTKAQMGIFEMDMTESLEGIYAAIIESHSYPIEEGQNYWAGWNLYDGYFCHGGNNPNFSSQVIVFEDGTKAVFALANINSAATTATADGIVRMLCGETLKIGLFLDGNSFVDLIGIVLCLIDLYVGICIWESRCRERKYVVVKIVGFILLAIAVAGFPYILHFNYSTLAVWYSPCLIAAVFGAVICMFGYATVCVRRKKV